MEAVKTVKPFKLFTKEEKAILSQYINGSKKITMNECALLGEQIGREPINVYQFIYRQRKLAAIAKESKKANSVKVSNDKTTTRDKSVKGNTPMFKQGEFIIPVSSWEVRTNNGTTSLVLKFDKSI
jgi:hypothetical protein